MVCNDGHGCPACPYMVPSVDSCHQSRQGVTVAVNGTATTSWRHLLNIRWVGGLRCWPQLPVLPPDRGMSLAAAISLDQPKV